jgi:hypothetical protein
MGKVIAVALFVLIVVILALGIANSKSPDCTEICPSCQAVNSNRHITIWWLGYDQPTIVYQDFEGTIISKVYTDRWVCLRCYNIWSCYVASGN